MRKILFADLDGTIVKCGRYYHAANRDIAAKVSEVYGFSEAQASELMGWLDVWAIRASQGFTRARYPRSMAAGVSAMGAIATGYIDPQLVAWAFQRADEVFDAPYEPFEGAIDTIIKYRDAGWHLVLCTKGDVEVQERKLALHNLRDLFAAIEITPVKSVDALRRICEQHGIDPLTAAYVGDSVRDDMTPAAHLGMTAIRVETQAEDMWTHEAIVDTVSHHVIPSLQHLPAVLPL